jgi:3-oxoacyl-(acyl-carrier-protein) synthase
MSMDAVGFLEPALDSAGLVHATEMALERSEVAADEVGLVVWAPQGNAQDRKVLQALAAVLPQHESVPLVTTTFNTGYIESASILVSLATTLRALSTGTQLWPQRTGMAELDSRALTARPKYVLACGSSDVGCNFALLVKLPD